MRNDFTKEELEAIIEAFDYIEDDPMWCSPIGWNDEMRAKVQSMIDNYLDMNYFTKEELIWLEEELSCNLEEYRQPDIAYDVHRKVKSMIDY